VAAEELRESGAVAGRESRDEKRVRWCLRAVHPMNTM
jgi:hypothetical protein